MHIAPECGLRKRSIADSFDRGITDAEEASTAGVHARVAGAAVQRGGAIRLDARLDLRRALGGWHGMYRCGREAREPRLAGSAREVAESGHEAVRQNLPGDLRPAKHASAGDRRARCGAVQLVADARV